MIISRTSAISTWGLMAFWHRVRKSAQRLRKAALVWACSSIMARSSASQGGHIGVELLDGVVEGR